MSFISAFFAFLLFWFIHFHVEQYLSLSSCKGGFLLEFYYIAILILVPIKLVSKLLIAGSPWMVLTCLEGSSEAVEWRMDRIQGAKREDTATC